MQFPPSLAPIRRLSSHLFIFCALSLAQSLSAQVSSLTQNSSAFSFITYNGSNLGDTFDNRNAGLDVTKQSGLNGSGSNWDLVGNAGLALLQVGTGTANDTYFRVRLADYKANGNSGSVFVLLNNGTTTFGLGVLMDGKNDGVYYFTPQAGTSLTANFRYDAPTFLQGASFFDYSRVSDIDSGAGQISGSDAFMTFRVLNSDLTGNSAPFAISGSTTYTAFTNNNSVLNTNINADYISFNGTGSINDPLTFGAVPEPATWISSGAMLTFAGLIWWRRRRRAAA